LSRPITASAFDPLKTPINYSKPFTEARALSMIVENAINPHGMGISRTSSRHEPAQMMLPSESGH
jgi:hypothetical protein